MAFSVQVPNLSGSPTLDAVTLDAGEAAVLIGTDTIGALAQTSGAGAGFTLFTPTANCAYRCWVRIGDAATGTPTNACLDEIIVTSYGGTAAITVLHSTTINGTPGARTYSNSSGAVNVAVASGTTWYADLVLIRFPA